LAWIEAPPAATVLSPKKCTVATNTFWTRPGKTPRSDGGDAAYIRVNQGSVSCEESYPHRRRGHRRKGKTGNAGCRAAAAERFTLTVDYANWSNATSPETRLAEEKVADGVSSKNGDGAALDARVAGATEQERNRRSGFQPPAGACC